MKPRISKKSEYSQGLFTPSHPEKYKGSLPIIFRSKLELKSFRKMDSSDKIITWGSESVIIPYVSPIDNRVHRYFIDLICHMQSADGTVKKLLIEVKPAKFCQKPTVTSRKSNKTVIYEQTQYIINNAKWEAAKLWAKKRDYLFFVLTEKDIDQF